MKTISCPWLMILMLLCVDIGGVYAKTLPRLVAVQEIGSYKLALFENEGNADYIWRRQGEKLGEYRIGRISGRHVDVLDVEGEKTELSMPPLPSADATDVVKRDWVNSDQNPMLWHPIRSSRAIERALRFFSEGDREKFNRWYMTYGWKAALVIDAKGLWSIGYENIYAEYREELLARRVRAFRKNLSPEQLTMYRELTATLPFDKYQDKRAKLAELRVKFEASLSPELMKVYRGFSKAEGIAVSSLN